jgi:dUTPase
MPSVFIWTDFCLAIRTETILIISQFNFMHKDKITICNSPGCIKKLFLLYQFVIFYHFLCYTFQT